MADEDWLSWLSEDDIDEDVIEEPLKDEATSSSDSQWHGKMSGNIYFPNINLSHLNEVLVRLMDSKVLQEAQVAKSLITIVNDKVNEIATDDVLGAIGSFITQCYTCSNLADTKKNSKARSIEIECYFNKERCKVAKCGPVSSSWSILLKHIPIGSVTNIVLQHILQHFWSVCSVESIFHVA